MKREVIWEDGETGRKTVGYVFGKGEPSVCVLGAASGSEAQALFIAARLVKKLKELEARGAMVSNHQVLVIADDETLYPQGARQTAPDGSGWKPIPAPWDFPGSAGTGILCPMCGSGRTERQAAVWPTCSACPMCC